MTALEKTGGRCSAERNERRQPVRLEIGIRAAVADIQHGVGAKPPHPLSIGGNPPQCGRKFAMIFRILLLNNKFFSGM